MRWDFRNCWKISSSKNDVWPMHPELGFVGERLRVLIRENLYRICAIKARFETVGNVLVVSILSNWVDNTVEVEASSMELSLRKGDGTKQGQRPRARDRSRNPEMMLMWLAIESSPNKDDTETVRLRLDHVI